MGTKTVTGAAAAFDRVAAVSTEMWSYTDFIEDPVRGSGDLHVSAAAGGSVTGTVLLGGTIPENHPGVWQVNTGPGSAAGRAFVLSGIISPFHFGISTGPTRIGWWVNSGLLLSTAVQRYVSRAGAGSITLPNTINFGVFFEYQDDENGGRWQAVTQDGIGQTTVDTGVTVGVFTWYKLEYEVNAAGTSVEFFIDGVSVATITTNIPAGITYDLFLSNHLMKLVGLGNRSWFVDAVYLRQGLTR